MYVKIVKEDKKTVVAEFYVDDIEMIRDYWSDTDYDFIFEEEEK